MSILLYLQSAPYSIALPVGRWKWAGIEAQEAEVSDEIGVFDGVSILVRCSEERRIDIYPGVKMIARHTGLKMTDQTKSELSRL